MEVILAALLLLPSFMNFAVNEADDAKLRDAVRFPLISTTTGIRFCTQEGIVLPQDPSELKAEVAALNKRLRGNATDAPLHIKLADLYGKISDTARADKASERGVDLYRQQINEEPKNAILLTELALALPNAKGDEAELLLRRAKNIRPHCWQVHVAAGRFITTRTMGLVIAGKSDAAEFGNLIAQNKVPADTLVLVADGFRRAEVEFAEAVRLAPAEPEARLHRGIFYLLKGFYQAGSEASQGREVNVIASAFNPACQAEMREVVRLQPTNVKAIAASIFVEMGDSLAARNGQEKSLADALPIERRRALDQKLQLLKKIVEGKDRNAAAAAAEIQGIIYMFGIHDKKETLVAMRQAVKLNPERALAWEALDKVLDQPETRDECLQTCLEHVKYKDDCRTRLLAARAYRSLNQFDAAEKQVRIGLKCNAADVDCHLAMAFLLLRRKEPACLAEAGEHLAAVEEQLTPDSAKLTRFDFVILQSVFLALSGKLEQSHMNAQAVPRLEPENEYATKVLELVKLKIEHSRKLVLRVSSPKRVNVGDNVLVGILVANTGSNDFESVLIKVVLPAQLEHSEGKDIQAQFEQLKAGERRSLVFRAKAKSAGAASFPIIAIGDGKEKADSIVALEVRDGENDLRPNGGLFEEESPADLVLQVTGPTDAKVGEEAVVQIKVVNNAKYEIAGVRLHAAMDNGLEHESGPNLDTRFGSLPGGESQSCKLRLKVNQPGTRSCSIHVSSRNDQALQVFSFKAK